MFTSMSIIIGERKPNDRYDVRSRDCHATDALCATVSSLMELVGVHPTCFLKKTQSSFEGDHHWNIQAKFCSVRIPTQLCMNDMKLSMKLKYYFGVRLWIFQKEQQFCPLLSFYFFFSFYLFYFFVFFVASLALSIYLSFVLVCDLLFAS